MYFPEIPIQPSAALVNLDPLSRGPARLQGMNPQKNLEKRVCSSAPVIHSFVTLFYILVLPLLV
jgi:hypothetical protein